MSTEVVDVLPVWTIHTTSASINHITVPESSTTATPPVIQQQSHSSDTLNANKSVRKFCSNDNATEQENTVGETTNDTNNTTNFDEQQHMTPRSPTTSLTSLPPLPDLIPIRKSNISHQASSTTAPIIATQLSTSSTSTSPSNNSCTNENLIDEANVVIPLSSQNLSETTENHTSPIQQEIEVRTDIDESKNQHSNTADQQQIELTTEEYEIQSVENTTAVTENIIREEISATPSNIVETTETMAPTAIISQDNQSVARNQQEAQKKRGRPKGPVGRTFNNSQMVQHRKSDRRRVERDIFFLFEEHPSNRRRGKKGVKKRGPGRPRVKPDPSPTKVSLSTSSVPPIPVVKKQIPPTVRISKQETTTHPAPSTENLVPRVNPIFLWVKQDDTRIVEVRCEDYDKRNRIRLTRTPNGWRSIPRTDTSSSRVVKLMPNPLRVKQELQIRPDLLENANGKNDVVGELVRRMKKNKKKKKKKKKRKLTSDQEDESDDDVRKLLSPSPKDVIVYESTNHERDEEHEENPPSLPTVDLESEPNNNEMSADLTKNLTQISDDIELDMPFMHHLQNETSMMTLCPQTGVFQPVAQVNQPTVVPTGNEHVIPTGFDPTEVVCHDVDSKHLKDLLDDDLLQHGAELIDSLVKRGCEDNHISEDEGNHPHPNHLHNPQTHVSVHPKNPMCLSNDFENEEDDILMQPEPVEDIISRLGESLAASPKCLSFNEVGEIEGLHGELFQTSAQPVPFNRTALEELSITIKDLEKSSETFVHPQKTLCDTNQRTVERTTTIVSPDSCVDELPKDLTCKKGIEISLKPQQPQSQIQIERSHSRSSDAIQSPQPSGLPAVPPSPDLMHSKNKFLDQLLNNSSGSPKICSSVTVTPIKITTTSQQQKEPLDLGKHRKSASPTVSCSEEAKRTQPLISANGNVSNDEPLQKRIKTEPEIGAKSPITSFVESLSSGKDPDPLTQLRLLMSNPEWKVPDPILVPKDRLSAVLASPAREIPHLLTTRPELRLPDAFAYPSILQDPDILVIPLSQLETILQKQLEVTKSKVSPIPQVTIEAVSKKRVEKPSLAQQPDISPVKKTPGKSMLNPMAPLLASGLANDIDAATFAAFNQMLWLPYLGQMAPEFFKAMAGLPNSANLAEMLPFLAQQQQQQQSQQQQQQQHQQQSQRQQYASQFNSSTVPNPMAFQNPLEIAMLQGALNQAQMQRALKMSAVNHQRDQVKKIPSETKFGAARNNFNMGPLFAQKGIENSRLPQQQQNQQAQSKGRAGIGVNPFQGRSQVRQCSTEKPNNMRQMNPYYPPHTGMEISPIRKTKQSPTHPLTEQKPRVTCKSLSNLLQPERLMQENKMSNLMAMPQFDFNQLHSHQQQNQLPSHLNSQIQESHQSHYSNHSNLPNPSGNANSSNSNSSGGQAVGKLKVKAAPHLLDPAAMQRRLLNYDEIPEVGSTTNGMDDIINDPNAHLWHPLFGSAQKTGYNSPWQWTTVTATGE